MLYGTTEGELGGSAALWGTVFSITTSGKEKTLYDFKGPPDGAYPVAGLAALNGAFYGTTQEGGTSGWGTVFSISTLFKEKVLHSFKGFAALVNTLTCRYWLLAVRSMEQRIMEVGIQSVRILGAGQFIALARQGRKKWFMRLRTTPMARTPKAACF